MPTRSEAHPTRKFPADDRDILLVMVPGMGMTGADFHTRGLIADVERRHPRITVTTADPGLDAYLDGSLEGRMLDAITSARRDGPRHLWLAGISLGCQAILRCVRAHPDLAEGLILLTPYLASTGLIAEIARTGGLRDWSAANHAGREPERTLLTWLATTPPAELPRMFVGRALGDRFATTASLLADLLPPHHVTNVQSEHDWSSWQALWGTILDQHPFDHSTPMRAWA